MKVLIASTAGLGHLNPLLAVANILIKHNHDVVVQTAPKLRPMVEAAGVPFTPEPPETNSSTDAMAFFLELKQAKNPNPGLEMAAFDLEYFFAKKIGGQAAGLKQALQDFPADVIVADSLFFGTLPMLLGAREERPAIVHLGVSLLNLFSASPPQPGMSQKEQLAERERRERVFHQPAKAGVDKALAELGCGPLPFSPQESMSVLPDLYLQHGIESFQYSDDSSSSSPVHYIGLLPMPPGQPALPTWWHELDRTKRLVLVTQGTIANRNFGQLIGPTLTGLAKEEDVIVLVSTGGQPIESILTEIPANAYLASFLPYELIMQSVDLLVTNGGYGTVNLALAHGIPIVSAGMTEDKGEVSAHVQWAGVGIDLRTNQATAEDLRAAAREVLDNPVYSERAKELALEFANHNTEMEVLRLIEACVLEPSTV
ncbi:glycosyltransferase [Coleofasciculus sp. FACHB-129]|uniref:glycosyltransferase n=1 Tax=Cyanophyceae TaxID=3028117 RepID=UPI0016825EF3|nr:glycosyltransferase [Coleofasciculus sp. FACHB-129]MBD1895877.1 glycosyltransferase family 1 protein [Coleofasciculus sp. FACHB-129]